MDWNGSDPELWKITPAVTSGYFTITNKASGLALDADGSGADTAVTISTRIREPPASNGRCTLSRNHHLGGIPE